MTTTDFNVWFESADPSDFEEIDSMYRSVNEDTEYGIYKTQPAKGNNNGWILSCEGNDLTLHILTPTAKKTFLKAIEARYCNNEPEHAWYIFQKEMSKND